MKRNYMILLISIIATTAVLSTPIPCRGAEAEDIWSEDQARDRQRPPELTKDETIERIMKQLGETDPKKAEELKQLREKEPEKFKAELRKVMREQFGRRSRSRRGTSRTRPRRESRSEHRRPMGPGPGEHTRPRRSGRMGQRYAEYIEWLEKNYPDEAKKLAELKSEDHHLYGRKLDISLKKYSRIKEASEENPQLAEVLKEDLKLKKERDRLLRKTRGVLDEKEKERLKKELEQLISSRFDLIVKRKQIAYEQLRQKLEKLKDQVKKSEAELEKQKDIKFKNESIKARMEELISRSEKFRWD